MKYSISDVHALCTEAFTACKVTSAQAGPTIDALILAEAQGLASHGISRVPMYLAHVTHGRVNPNAVPVVSHFRPVIRRLNLQFKKQARPVLPLAQ